MQPVPRHGDARKRRARHRPPHVPDMRVGSSGARASRSRLDSSPSWTEPADVVQRARQRTRTRTGMSSASDIVFSSPHGMHQIGFCSWYTFKGCSQSTQHGTHSKITTRTLPLPVRRSRPLGRRSPGQSAPRKTHTRVKHGTHGKVATRTPRNGARFTRRMLASTLACVLTAGPHRVAQQSTQALTTLDPRLGCRNHLLCLLLVPRRERIHRHGELGQWRIPKLNPELVHSGVIS